MARPTPRCPVRNEPCNLCVPGADGPHNCGLVWLVRDDPDLAAQFNGRHGERPEPEPEPQPTHFLY